MIFGGEIMLRIAICDDIPEHALELETAVRQLNLEIPLTMERYVSAASLLERIRTPVQFDVVMMDIELVNESGIRAAEEISRVSPATQIIFVSAYLARAVDIFETAHIYFLLKPIDPQRLKNALERALKKARDEQERILLLHVRGGASVTVPFSDVLYFERMLRTTVVNCAGTAYETPTKLAELEGSLPDAQFSRPHNSYLVNLAHVRKIERFCLHLGTGDILPISNQRRPAFRSALEEYIRK